MFFILHIVCALHDLFVWVALLKTELCMVRVHSFCDAIHALYSIFYIALIGVNERLVENWKAKYVKLIDLHAEIR